MEIYGFGRAGRRFSVEHSGLMRLGATAQLYHRGEPHTEADVYTANKKASTVAGAALGKEK